MWAIRCPKDGSGVHVVDEDNNNEIIAICPGEYGYWNAGQIIHAHEAYEGQVAYGLKRATNDLREMVKMVNLSRKILQVSS